MKHFIILTFAFVSACQTFDAIDASYAQEIRTGEALHARCVSSNNLDYCASWFAYKRDFEASYPVSWETAYRP